MFFLPESPRWLARKDRYDEAHQVLILVHGHGDPNSPYVAAEFRDIKAMCALEAQNSDASYWELFTPNMINRTHVGVFTQIWSQLTGKEEVPNIWLAPMADPLHRNERNDVVYVRVPCSMDTRSQADRLKYLRVRNGRL